MNRYLSHTSALEWLAYAKADPLAPAAADRRERLPRHDGTPLPPAGKTTRADVDGLASFGLGYLAKPVHLLVPSSECRIRCADARCHVRSGPFPARSFLPIDEGTFSSSPELAFVQMAEVLDCPRLVKLGDELCGIYGIETVGIVDFDRTSPFTTVKRLGRFLLKAECMPGLVKARKAVRHIAPGSASPMETAIVLLLCLPPRLGGYGLPRPVMKGEPQEASLPQALRPTLPLRPLVAGRRHRRGIRQLPASRQPREDGRRRKKKERPAGARHHGGIDHGQNSVEPHRTRRDRTASCKAHGQAAFHERSRLAKSPARASRDADGVFLR